MKTVSKKQANRFWKVGNKYFIRTVTNYYVGELAREEEDQVILKKAAWVADTGRFADFLKTGNANEVEPYPDNIEVAVPKTGVIDASQWSHTLPMSQK
jgi:hypothetical protein